MVVEAHPVPDAIAAVAALEDDNRRSLYDFIRRARQPVTREQAAAAVGISRKLAAFHLDKLVDTGLLRVHTAPAGGIRKVGRRPKVYLPGEHDIRVAIPERRADMLAEILLAAVLTERADENAQQAALRTARDRGFTLGIAEREQTRPGRLGAERALTLTKTALARHGFEPSHEAPTCVRLRNCPFHPLAAGEPELVCGINHAYLTGFLHGLRAATVEAVLAPRPAECCVELRATPGPSPLDTSDS